MSTTRYHFNPTTGKTGVCGADPAKPKSKGCRFKLSEDQHYATADEAGKGYAEFLEFTEGVTTVLDGISRLRADFALTAEEIDAYGLDSHQIEHYNSVIATYLKTGGTTVRSSVDPDHYSEITENIRSQIEFPSSLRDVWSRKGATKKERMSALMVAYGFDQANRMKERLLADESLSELSPKESYKHADEFYELKGVKCWECNEPLSTSDIMTESDWGGFDCPMCGTKNYSDALKAECTPEHDTYPALDAENVSKMRWYHSTENGSWDSALSTNGGVYVHVGSAQAALDRQLSRQKVMQNTGYWVYELGVKETATIAPEVAEDDNDDYTGHNHPINEPHEHQVQRYINNIEEPGSISLVVDSNVLEVRNRKWVTRSEATSQASLYNVQPRGAL